MAFDSTVLEVSIEHFPVPLLSFCSIFLCGIAENGSGILVHPLAWWVTTSNESLLSQLQEVPHLHPHFLASHLWVSSMVMFVLQVTTVLKGVQSQAPVLQVENIHIQTKLWDKWKWYPLVTMYHENVANQKLSIYCMSTFISLIELYVWPLIYYSHKILRGTI